jgi:acyl carrier protein
MGFEDIQPQIRVIVARLARIDAGFSAKADVFRELGLESAAALDLVLQLEEDYGITIDDESFGAARTLEQITKLVVDLRGEAA